MAQVESKYRQQIEGYEKKGINALTKKLIEKTQQELLKAQNKKREEMMAEKELRMQKIREGRRISDADVSVDTNLK